MCSLKGIKGDIGQPGFYGLNGIKGDSGERGNDGVIGKKTYNLNSMKDG